MNGNRFGSGLPMTARVLRLAAFAVAALALAACNGGGGSSPAPTDPPGPTEPPPDPTGPDDGAGVARVGDILARADALLFSNHHMRWSLSGGGATLSDTVPETMECAGVRCVAGDGTVVTIADLATPATVDPVESEGTLGRRDGFDTFATRVGFELTERVPGVTATADPSLLSYGFWGMHGFAALEVGAGPLTGEVDGTAFTGDFSLARAYAVGAVSGSNPVGQGGAVWRGIAEASPTGAFVRLTGTATVRIADLSRPRVGVAIEVPGHDIGAPGWANMPLVNGSFATGTAGSDRLAGNLHGPRHEEAWGVFDTDGYIGAFGARRGP